MLGILRKRFREISDRKKMHIKIRWFEPLNREELDKLGVNEKNEKAMAI